ncbi:MAG: ZIP family metal transporter [Candidatus Nanohaloarchaea archaeon]
MTPLENFVIVFTAGLVTALATGLGAVPLFFFRDISDRLVASMWGFAGGIMLSASVFGLILEGLKLGTFPEVGTGLALGALLVAVADRVIHDYEFKPREIAEADFKKMMLILGVLTVHSFPEGVAIGVSFAEIGVAGVESVPVLGLTVPLLAVFMTLAISIQNIPEGLAVSIPMNTFGYSKRRMVGAAVFSSLPQPIGAVLAFYFVVLAKQLLPLGFGFAAGAMFFLVFDEMVPEALERNGRGARGVWEIALATLAGFLIIVPLLFL